MGLVNSTLSGQDLNIAPPPRFMCLQEWLKWQEGLHFTAIDLGLDRCRKVAENMGLLDPDFAVISVAGTNGKGSSVTMLDMILRASSYRVGKYTSPHLIRYNERICVDGKEADDELLCQAFDRVDKARGDISLTYFEFGTLAALDVFRQSAVQIAILEVGLGGRLDAVNILGADAALVTSIDIDHEDWLGHDRESIGREKAGIFRQGKAAVCSDPMPPESVTRYAEEIGANLQLLGIDYHYEISDGAWNWQSGTSKYHDLARPSAVNDCQIQNAAGVLMLLKSIAARFPVSYDAVKDTMKNFCLRGRFQIEYRQVPYILDVAHNRQAAELLVTNLKKLPKTGRLHCVVGMLKDKNHELIFLELGKIVDCWYVADLDSDRAASSGLLKDKLLKTLNPEQVFDFDDINLAFEKAASQAEPVDRILITGSFLTVTAAILWLQKGK